MLARLDPPAWRTSRRPNPLLPTPAHAPALQVLLGRLHDSLGNYDSAIRFYSAGKLVRMPAYHAASPSPL